MKDRLKEITYRLDSNFFIMVIRHGLTMMIPFVLTGGIANALLNLPVQEYQNIIKDTFWVHLFNVLYVGTFGLFSMAMLIALSCSYSMERNMPVDKTILYVIVSIGAYGVQFYNADGGYHTEMLDVRGCFFAIVTALVSCILMEKLQKIPLLSFQEQTNKMEGITAVAISAVIPAIIVILVFACSTQCLLKVFDASSIYELLSGAMCRLFDYVDSEFLTGLLYTFLLHFMWIFGLHGSHILEPVATTSFLIGRSGDIFSKSFFDTFVVMGGCGTTVCVLIAILLFGRNARMRKMAELSSFTVIFNLNEILTFGIPIILNPIMVIPFICTPVICYMIAFGATYIGLIPPVTHTVPWSTPVFLSGYIGTGSLSGSLLQLVMIAIGMAVYVPFLRVNEAAQRKNAEEQIHNVIRIIQEKEELNEDYDLLSKPDQTGQICRMLQQDLKNAIRNKELYLLLQPQVDDKGICIGGEALLRWKHPFYGMIYPPLIVYLAKESDLIEELEKLIIDQTVSAIADINRKCGPDFKISMNLTAKSLLWDVEKYIDKALKEKNVPASQLWLEITEQDVLTKSSTVIEKLNYLKSQGHVMMIDDFGMGHTSILYLQSSSFGVIKLDGSLVKNILDNTTDQQIVSSIVTLADKLGIQIIAEYVENEEQRDKLLELGCKFYQGYLYEKPVPLDEFINYMGNHSL